MPKTDKPPDAAGGVAKLRVDKWLWSARMYRTRSLAAAAVETGQVRVDGERVKPSRAVHVGEHVNVRKGGLDWELEVMGLSERRGSATDAAQLYTETEASRQVREGTIANRKAAAASDPRMDGRASSADASSRIS